MIEYCSDCLGDEASLREARCGASRTPGASRERCRVRSPGEAAIVVGGEVSTDCAAAPLFCSGRAERRLAPAPLERLPLVRPFALRVASSNGINDERVRRGDQTDDSAGE